MRTKDKIEILYPKKLEALVTPRNNEGRIRFIKHSFETNPLQVCTTDESDMYNKTERSKNDAKGSRVYRKTFNPTTPYGRMDIIMKNASSGVYFVDLTDGAGNRLASGKVVVKP